MRKTVFTLIVFVFILSFSSGVFAIGSTLPMDDLEKDYENAILNTFKFPKNQENGFSLNVSLRESAGTTGCDWLAFACGRYGYPDNAEGYLKSLEDYVTARYAALGELHKTMPTDYHRVALAVMALGGDPTCFGKKPDGSPVNLLADGVYNHKSLENKSINVYIWGLIAVDAQNTAIPNGAKYDRNFLIQAILEEELNNGGFALIGEAADPDITGMALVALAPYYDSDPEVK
ncbi:MAG: hypothetical protein Q4C00_06075, partial [Bacillota bacterium]|nr:hypothetical protein [Bacillota bacterium]